MSSKLNKEQGRVKFPELEDEVLKFWKENDIFEKSVEQRPEDKKYTFIDGPPFVSGMPHYGHVLCGVAKDLFPRYWTMKGYRVRRRGGWDCHGLPIEAKVNKKFGIKSSAQVVEEFGVEKYVQECRNYVNEHVANWGWYYDKMGRWMEQDDAYYTMNPEFNESVIWAFKQMWEKGYIYKGKRVSLYSTDTETPVSNFEVAMDTDNYQDTTDTAVFVKFKLKDHDFDVEEDVHMVAWTTTPWTLPNNFALAVNPTFTYALVKYEGYYLVLGKDLLASALELSDEQVENQEGYELVAEFKGEKVEGLQYEPVFDFYVDQSNENDFKVYLLDDVTNDEGTGVLHIAPAYGEVDFNFGQEVGLSDYAGIDSQGLMQFGPWKGEYLRDASPKIAEKMDGMGNLLRSESYVHRLPYYRGDNPLIYMAQDSYFVNVQKIKDRMLELNEDVNWYPEHLKDGRAKHIFETSPDWAISRSRFWATIMPLWLSEDGDELVVGSIEEMAQYTDQIETKEVDGKTEYYVDGEKLHLHRDFCDKIVLEKDGREYTRVPFVLDSWMDAGAVPFAEYHYPFENEEQFKNGFPADFIVEYVGQVRAWFNMLFRVSVMLFDDVPFKNVLATGTLGGNDGRKMSKTYGNYPDPEDVLKEKGGEALRLYMMSSPLMNGKDAYWDDEDLDNQVKTVLLPFWNTYRYLTLYADLNSWTPSQTDFVGENVLDKWLESHVNKFVDEYSSAIEDYDAPASVRLIQPLFEGISSWWIRRSRDRFADGDEDALQNLYAALYKVTLALAPQLPFLTEHIYENLVKNPELDGGKESIHLEDYPEVGEYNEELLAEMEEVKQMCSVGLNLREKFGLKLRQPVAKVYTSMENEELRKVVRNELNAKEVVFVEEVKAGAEFAEVDKFVLGLDVELTDALELEGLANEFARQIQRHRKSDGFNVGDKIDIFVQTTHEKVLKMLKQHEDVVSDKVDAVSVQVQDDVEGTQVKVNEFTLVVKLSDAEQNNG